LPSVENYSGDELVAELTPEPLDAAEVFRPDCFRGLDLASDDLSGRGLEYGINFILIPVAVVVEPDLLARECQLPG